MPLLRARWPRCGSSPRPSEDQPRAARATTPSALPNGCSRQQLAVHDGGRDQRRREAGEPSARRPGRRAARARRRRSPTRPARAGRRRPGRPQPGCAAARAPAAAPAPTSAPARAAPRRRAALRRPYRRPGRCRTVARTRPRPSHPPRRSPAGRTPRPSDACDSAATSRTRWRRTGVAQVAQQRVHRTAGRLDRLEDPRQRRDRRERVVGRSSLGTAGHQHPPSCARGATLPGLVGRVRAWQVAAGHASPDHASEERPVSDEALENLLTEDAQVPAAAAVRGRGQRAARRSTTRPPPTGWRSGSGRPHRLQWEQPWDQVLDWSDAPFAKWFVGGRLNVADNCVDRHVEAGHGDQVAIHFEGEPGDTRTLTYAELQREVSRAANALTELGVRPGDRVAIYLPMIPEAAVAMLACARIGAAALGGVRRLLRRGPALPHRRRRRQGRHHRRRRLPARQAASALKPAVDEAVALSPRRRARPRRAPHRAGRRLDRGPRRVVARHRRPAAGRRTSPRPSTPSTRCSSSTRRARRGSRRASCTPPAATSPRSRTRTATSSTSSPTPTCTGAPPTSAGSPATRYIVYGPLANGATQVMYEGTPDTPHQGRFWEIVEKYRRHDPLHRADRDPHVHEVGRRHPRGVRPDVAAAARLGRRADQPRGVDVVPPASSAATAAPSSTPGGRPRPARS